MSTIGLSQIAAAQFLHVYQARATGSTAARPGRSAGPSPPRSACASPIRTRNIVAISGDYDFQFLIEELAVGAQFGLPYLHILVNNAYLGLIRQAQRGFEMDYSVQLSFDNCNAPELGGYGVDHVAVARAWAARRSASPSRTRSGRPSCRRANWMAQFQVPVVVEIMLERVTNIAMGTEIDKVVEFEDLAEDAADAPTAIALLD